MGIQHGNKPPAPRARGAIKSHIGQRKAGERKKANKLAAEQKRAARARRLGVTIAELRAMEMPDFSKDREIFVGRR